MNRKVFLMLRQVAENAGQNELLHNKNASHRFLYMER